MGLRASRLLMTTSSRLMINVSSCWGMCTIPISSQHGYEPSPMPYLPHRISFGSPRRRLLFVLSVRGCPPLAGMRSSKQCTKDRWARVIFASRFAETCGEFKCRTPMEGNDDVVIKMVVHAGRNLPLANPPVQVLSAHSICCALCTK